MDKKRIVKNPILQMESNALAVGISNWRWSGKIGSFEEILVKLGYCNGETLILDDYDQKKCSFSCSCTSNGQTSKVKITLKYGTNEDFPEITVSTNEIDKNYFVCGDANKEKYLELHWYMLKNSDNGNKLYHLLQSRKWEAETQGKKENETYRFSISAIKPENKPGLNHYELENIKELQNYLLSLSFPISIEEVYRKLCELSLTPVSKFPGLTMCSKIKARNGEYQVTDLVDMANGIIKKFVITRDGKTITLEGESWSYQSGNVTISRDENGKVSYNLISVPERSLFDLMPVSERYIMARADVEKAKSIGYALNRK